CEAASLLRVRSGDGDACIAEIDTAPISSVVRSAIIGIGIAGAIVGLAEACGTDVRETDGAAGPTSGVTGGSLGSAGAPWGSSSASLTGGAGTTGIGGSAGSAASGPVDGSADADAADPCAPICGPIELCDSDHLGLDDNCDGVVDEGC